MIFYILLLALSVGGIITLFIRHQRDLVRAEETFDMAHPPTFAQGMNWLWQRANGWWRSHLREESLLFLEKRLRGLRIWALKIEHSLFRATHHIRGISTRNGTSSAADTRTGTEKQ